MFHEPPKNFLYSSYRVDARHTDSMGTVKEGLATGFVVEGKAGEAWFITNRHVVDLNYRQTSEKFKDFKLAAFSITGRRSDDSIYTFNLHSDARMFFHDDEENDVVVIEPRCVWEDIPENQRSLHWHFGREHFADELVFKESLQPFDVVCYAGFPDQHDKMGNRPILRSGHIASDPRYDYSWDSKPRGQCVAYEGFSFSGSSGSPIFCAVQRHGNYAQLATWLSYRHQCWAFTKPSKWA